MVAPIKRPATYADVLAAPEHMVAELLGGELHLQPRPAIPHAHSASALGMILGPAFHRGVGGPGGWILLDEPELHFGTDVLVPDMAGWLRESAVIGELTQAYITSPPRWVLEALSPSTARKDRLLKLPRYHLAGVGFVWLLDPMAQTVEIYRRADEGWLLVATHGGHAGMQAEPFEAITIELSELWVETEADEDGSDRSG